MISSRRLAREWALKILYQMDVGGSSLSDARDSALERLRTEFVQRGSRNAIGSTAELICLEYVTSSLCDSLVKVRLPFEQAVITCLEGAFCTAPRWQEACFERAFKAKFKGHKLRPARLLFEDSAGPMPTQVKLNVNSDAFLSSEETARLAEFETDLAIKLPILLAVEMRKTARKTVAALTVRWPNTTMLWDSAAEQQLLNERIRFNADASERWRKVAQIVQKQTTDWFRVGGFTARLVGLTEQRRAEIDGMLSDLASGWKLDRQAAVDRNILRLAALEMLYIPEIPYTASINEAVELAKKFSTNESGRFVNGVLGAAALRIGDKPPVTDPIAAPGDDLIEDVTDSIEIVGVGDVNSGIDALDPTSGISLAQRKADTEESV